MIIYVSDKTDYRALQATSCHTNVLRMVTVVETKLYLKHLQTKAVML